MKTHIFQDKLVDSLNKFKTNTAVECGDQRLTYEEIDRRSNYIAHRLAAEGFQKESFVGILTRDIPRLITVIVGVLKAGCVFIPLEPAYPKKRLAEMIRSVDAQLVIGDKADIEYFSENAAETAAVFTDLDDWYPRENAVGDADSTWFEEPPPVTYHPEDKIYIYFTSGSTGVPKAIVGRNKGLNHFIQWEIDTFAVDHTFRVSQFTNAGFDPFLRDIFVPLCAGGTLCIPSDRDLILNDRSLIQWLDQTRIILVHTVPSFFKLAFQSDALESRFLQDLKYVLLAGEKLEPAYLTRWYRTFGDRIQLVNIYGPTETTLAKIYYLLRESDLENEAIPIGKPIRGTRVIILDNNMEICDELEVGELYIRTPYRSHGYYKNDEANRQRFIPNPFSNNPDDIIYKTGDLARSLPDGNIELVGRVDRQVKIRGIRVELEGIESALVKHPHVKEATVITNKGPGGNVSLIAFITGTGDVENLTTVVKNDLYDQLPEHMVPARIIQIEKMPRKPNFKVDYDQLNNILKNEIRDYIAPRNHTEEKLTGIWSQVLGMEKIGVTDNFFELGGDSLNIMPLVTKIHKEFNVKVTLKDAFGSPTVEAQAELIAGAEEDKYSAVQKAENKDFYPLSPAQERLYTLQYMYPENTGYNMPISVILEGNLELPRMEDTFKKLIRRHEALATSFQLVEGEPFQKIHDDVEFKVEYIDLTTAPASGKDIVNNVDNFVRPFDLSRAPLLRVGLLKIRPMEYILMVDIHHIVSDGISQGILVKDFMEIYGGKELPPLRLQYKDISEWYNSVEYGLLRKSREAFWLKEFEGIENARPLNLRPDYERPPVLGFEGSTVSFAAGKENLRALKALLQEEGVTLFSGLLALYVIMLAKISGQDDIVVGTPVAGRNHVELENIIGMFINTVALRNYYDGKKTFADFLAAVSENALAAFENQEYQFEDLVRLLVKDRDKSRNPLFDVVFVLQNMDLQELEIPGLKLKQHEMEKRISKFDLTLRCVEGDDDCFFSIEYSTRLFKKEKVERYRDYFIQIMETVIKNKHIRLEDIEVAHRLSPVETKHVAVEFDF